MSATSFTDWAVSCDHPECPRVTWATDIEVSDPTATRLRKALKRRGWTVAVPGEPGDRRRKDFCPDHKPKEG